MELRYLIGRLALLSIFGLLLFAAAGRWDWPRAWLYLGVVALLELVSAIVLNVANAAVLAGRRGLASDAPPFERAFVAIYMVLALATPIVIGLEVRSAGGASLSVGWMVPGVALLIVSYGFATWAMAVNEHFELLVRIQEDRDHQVVSTGPYRIVRHPGYLAAIVGALASPLVLGSAWAFVPVAASALLFGVRTALEDRTLQTELGGYAEYAAITRYRLLPGVW